MIRGKLFKTVEMKKFLLYSGILSFLLLCVNGLMAQNATVKGTIYDQKTGDILPGANIIIKGSTTGTASDVMGTYKFEVPAGQVTLVASFLGFASKEKSLTLTKGQTLTVDFTLGEDMMMLDETVVVGYGTKRKRDITSSISKVKAEEMANIPVPTFETALQGRAPGVQITQDNGMTSGAVTVRIRGTSSLKASSQPLYVVDGVPIISGSYTTSNGFPDQTNVLSLINPNDIESIEILKDASAAAIYGARSTNGVVLITTKKGKEGKPKINVNYYTGISDVTHRMEILDGPEYLDIAKEAWYNSYLYSDKPTYKTIDEAEKAFYQQLPFGIYDANKTYEENKAIIDTTNTDWVGQSLRKGSIQSISLSASGGTKALSYFVGGTFDDKKGILKGDALKRATGRINVSYRGSEKLSFGGNLSFTKSFLNRIPTSWAGGQGTAQSRSLPIMPVYDSAGNFFAAKTSGKSNIVAERVNLDYLADIASVLGNVYAEYKIIDGLSFKSDFGLNNIYQREYKYEGTILYEDAAATERRVFIETYNFKNSLNYSKSFSDVHDFSALLAMDLNTSNQKDVEFWGNQFPSPDLKNPNSAAKQGGSAWETGYAFLSYIGRMTYGFKGKYLASLSVRRDGASRFGPGQRFGWFPAASVGWIISDEDFWKAVPYMTFFKIRGSFGATGNSEIGNHRYLGTYYITKYNGLSGIGVGNIANPDLHWEKTNQADVGVDFGLWEGRISGAFDWYYKRTTDMLLDVNVPQTSGVSNVIKNVGELENKGLEFYMRSYNTKGKLSWITEINLGRNVNNIINIEKQIISGLDLGGNYGNNFAQEGHPIGAWRLVEFAGVDPQTGAPLFINQETGEKTTEFNYDRDAVVVGNPYPDLYGGINNIISWKGFDFSFLFSFAVGQDVYRDDGKFLEAGKIGSSWNQMATVLDRWQQPGDNASIPKLIWEDKYSTYNSTQFLDDASYGRLKNVSLGYTLPNSLTKKMSVATARVYFTGTNILTFTKYPGWDPEVNRDSSGNVTQGVTYLSPPQAKTFTFGVSLDF